MRILLQTRLILVITSAGSRRLTVKVETVADSSPQPPEIESRGIPQDQG